MLIEVVPLLSQLLIAGLQLGTGLLHDVHFPSQLHELRLDSIVLFIHILLFLYFALRNLRHPL